MHCSMWGLILCCLLLLKGFPDHSFVPCFVFLSLSGSFLACCFSVASSERGWYMTSVWWKLDCEHPMWQMETHLQYFSMRCASGLKNETLERGKKRFSKMTPSTIDNPRQSKKERMEKVGEIWKRQMRQNSLRKSRKSKAIKQRKTNTRPR